MFALREGAIVMAAFASLGGAAASARRERSQRPRTLHQPGLFVLPAGRSDPRPTGAGSCVLALSFPVDYWDYIGWKDTLAAPNLHRRQKAYASTSGKGAGLYAAGHRQRPHRRGRQRS